MKTIDSSIHRFGLVAARVVVAGALTWALAQNASADLKHRYSFNTDNDASDSVGTAHGTIMNNAIVSGGWAAFYASAVSGVDCDYIELPPNMITGFTTATFEMWIDVWENGNWPEIYAFGNQNTGGAGAHMLMFTPHSGAGDFRMSYAQGDPGYNDEHVVLAAGTLDNLGPCAITCVYDPPNNTMSLYKDGLPVNSVTLAPAVGFSLSKVVNNFSWLGRSLYNLDAGFNGAIDEFRIYDGALNPVEVAASFVSGAENQSTDSAVLGGVQAVHLFVPQTTMTQGDTQPTSATADFAALVGVSLKGVPGVTYTSDKPAVLKVSNTGVLEAAAAGLANLTLAYGGESTSVPITVNARQTGVAVAGTLWVDLRAEDVQSDTTLWPNRTLRGDFGAAGNPLYDANVSGTGLAGVQFAGTDAYLGPATTDDLDGASDRSIEVWVYNPVITDEETLVAWSRRGGPDGSNLSFNYGANGSYGAVGHWGASDMGWSGTPPAGTWHYLVYTYDGAQTARVYADGLLKTEKALAAPLATHPGLPIRIAAQANTSATDFDFNQSLRGSIAMVRIHGGMLSGGDVANNYLYGVELTPPGELQGVTLRLSPATLLARAIGQAYVTADYANRKYLDVLPYCTLESSDPSVVTITANGVYTAVKVGTATIKASYGGKETTQEVTVTPLPPTELVHRYSFSEAPGITSVEDTAGDADGTVKGNGADFDGAGKLTLPGGGASNASAETIAGYVDLPNGILGGLVNASFEAWVSWDTVSHWGRIFDFGTSAGGEDISNGNGSYVFLTPFTSATAPGGDTRFAVRDPRTSNEPTVLNAATSAAGTEVYLAVSYNYSDNQTTLYRDGVQIASGVAATPLNILNDVNNWLGRSQWGDAMFQGKYNEFRIWNGPLTAFQVALNTAAGPDNPAASDPGDVQSVELTLPTTQLVFGRLPVQAALLADFQNVANVNVTTQPGTTFTSSDPSIVTISPAGLVNAANVGTATLTGNYGGKSSPSVSVTVSMPQGYTPPTLVHRYSFSEAVGSTSAKDSIGTADGEIKGTGAAFDGTGTLALPGGGASNASAETIAGYVDLPNDFISTIKDLSIEAWVTWQGTGAWQRIFDFGTSAGGEDIADGSGNYMFLSPAGGVNLRFSVRDPATNGEPAPLTAATPLEAGREILLTVVYDYTANVARLYRDAELVAWGQAPVDLTTIAYVNNWLGRSQWPDAMFQGKYNELRIWDGVLLPDRVAANYAAGPDSLEPKPTLAVSAADGHIVIAWPASSAFALEATATLGATASWSAVDTSSAVVEGSLKKLTVTPSQAATFYRMKK